MEGELPVDEFSLHIAEKDVAFEDGSQLLRRILLSQQGIAHRFHGNDSTSKRHEIDISFLFNLFQEKKEKTSTKFFLDFTVCDTEPEDRLSDVPVLRGKRQGSSAGYRGRRRSPAVDEPIRRS